ncbi:unnamed protein product [Rangifer tarandus platyrhynchus]|uniref:Uncharacterized protein n=1 Tax=Rangifer tarandus platyrhynchus TaxID=3082113 RepID=A0AC59YV91_RANTA
MPSAPHSLSLAISTWGTESPHRGLCRCREQLRGALINAGRAETDPERGAGWLACSALEAQVSLFCEVSQQENHSTLHRSTNGPVSGICAECPLLFPKACPSSLCGKFLDINSSEKCWPEGF